MSVEVEGPKLNPRMESTRLYVLTGAPGTGKSAILGRLAEVGTAWQLHGCGSLSLDDRPSG
jgi:predicted ATPase